MGFLKKLFGSDTQQHKVTSTPYVDTQGIYFYVQCDHCGAPVRLRADKQHDLLNDGDSYLWHKTIVDSRCFRRLPTVVRLNLQYEIIEQTIEGGHYITEAEYQLLVEKQKKSAEEQRNGGVEESEE
jgi:hypothetical protein